MLDPIIKTIEVPCSQEKAFGVFVNKINEQLVAAGQFFSISNGWRVCQGVTRRTGNRAARS